mgnify:CR=1 FL=1
MKNIKLVLISCVTALVLSVVNTQQSSATYIKIFESNTPYQSAKLILSQDNKSKNSLSSGDLDIQIKISKPKVDGFCSKEWFSIPLKTQTSYDFNISSWPFGEGPTEPNYEPPLFQFDATFVFDTNGKMVTSPNKYSTMQVIGTLVNPELPPGTSFFN